MNSYDDEIVEILADVFHEADDNRMNENNELTNSDGNESAGFVGVRPRVLETVGYLYEDEEGYQRINEEKSSAWRGMPDVTEYELVKRSEVMGWLEAFRDAAVEELQSSSGLDKADQRHLQSKISVMDELIDFFEKGDNQSTSR